MPRKLLENKFELVDAEIDNNSAYTENASISNVRKLTVSGKTYQNLSNVLSGKITKNQTILMDGTLLKTGTSYTLMLDISSFSYDYSIGLVLYIYYSNGANTSYIGLEETATGILKRKITINNPVSSIMIGVHNSNSNECYCNVNSIVFLEGDHTNTEIPTEINGIESVAEREKTEANLYPIQIAQSHNETDGIVLPNGVTNTIENGVHVKRIGKAILNGSEQWRVNAISGATITTRFGLYGEELINAKVKGSCLCDRFPNIDSDSDNEHIKIGSPTPRFFIYINKSRLSTDDVDGFKEYLSNNPILLYYELETPITEPSAITEVNMPIPLRSLPNGVCDTIENGKLIQRIGKYTITGNETYSLRFQNDYMFVVQFEKTLTETAFDDYINSNTKMICDKALCKDCSNSTFFSISLTIGGRLTNSKGFVIAIPKSLLTEYTVAKAKEYIQSLGGITVYYELKTPIEHTINIPPISIAKGTNMVTTNNNIKPELTFKYKRKYKKSSTNNIKYLYNSGNEYSETTGGYLTSSNNSATCNIEKQADNLYVNCTGKGSFDSICYARTNKTIKPCKIKVSVKNNYISANGVAFCMFLSEKEAITSVSDFNSVVNKKYIKASNTTPNEYIDLEMDLTDSTEGYFYIACMVAGSADYRCKANIRKIEIIR